MQVPEKHLVANIFQFMFLFLFFDGYDALYSLDSRLRGNDKRGAGMTKTRDIKSVRC